MAPLTVGTRGSALALLQTEWVVRRLKTCAPSLEIKTRVIKTKGDRILDVPLARIGDKGLFVKELEYALLAGEVDFVVHSMKDVPTEIPEGLCIAAVPEREDPRDALISSGAGLADLPSRARVGSSSLRRRAQLLHYRPDLTMEDVRGNLDTRLRKLDEGKFDALVLACAGLRRLGLACRITETIPLEICLPAAGQGALAVQARSGDDRIRRLLAGIDHPPSRTAVTAERSFLRALGGGCQIPVATYARIVGGTLEIVGLVASVDGTRTVRRCLAGDPEQPDELGRELAESLMTAGADGILAEVAER